MIVVAWDTATADTVVALGRPGAPTAAARHQPAPGERPAHAAQLLPLARGLLAGAGLGWADVDRIGVDTLHALALGAAAPGRGVLACLDARRGEAWVAAWRGERCLLTPRAVLPDALAALADAGEAPWWAVGDGSVRFRAQLEAGGALVPANEAAEHHVGAAALCELALRAEVRTDPGLEPTYLRSPDAVPKHLR